MTVKDYSANTHYYHIDFRVAGSFAYTVGVTSGEYNKTEIILYKVWDDDDYENRPESVTYTVTYGEQTKTYTLTEDACTVTENDDGTTTWEYELGTDDFNYVEGASYSVTETVPEGYAGSEAEIVDLQQKITNAYYTDGNYEIYFCLASNYENDVEQGTQDAGGFVPRILINTAGGNYSDAAVYTLTDNGDGTWSYSYTTTETVNNGSEDVTYTFTGTWTYDESTDSYSYTSNGVMMVTSVTSIVLFN